MRKQGCFGLGESNSATKNGGSFRKVFSRKVDWGSLKNIAKEWIKNPVNMVMLIWIICVTISGTILFLVITGMLNTALPKKSQRNSWFEVNNQILNALFTLMSLYQHPHRLHHLVMLVRWRSEDISRLRKLYCKNACKKPREQLHMFVVVVLLNINCFGQYILCGLNVGYSRSERPVLGVAIALFFTNGSPAAAGVYSLVSPLGKDYNLVSDIESQIKNEPETHSGSTSERSLEPFEKKFFFASKDNSRTIISNPKWSGGIFDFWEDIKLAYLSLFCSCYVFGWNMERLGFGNMYVHIATFTLLCTAPFWILDLAAINIDNETVREALGITGMILCVFGLLYGGFWRTKMRKRYNLPSSDFCCGKPAIADCTLWLCCCWCSLAQEVRTGNSYDIVEDTFFEKAEAKSSKMPILPLPREGENLEPRCSPLSPSRDIKESQSPSTRISTEEEGSSSKGNDVILKSPVPPVIHR